MKKVKNPFQVICKEVSDAEIMQFKSHLVILLMQILGGRHNKRKDMAAELGCSQGEMSRIANGYISSVSIEKLLKHLSKAGFSVSSSLLINQLSANLEVKKSVDVDSIDS